MRLGRQEVREMKDERKTKKQLVGELAELRRRIAELEAAETERARLEEEPGQAVEALPKSEERYRSLFEGVPVGPTVSHPRGASSTRTPPWYRCWAIQTDER